MQQTNKNVNLKILLSVISRVKMFNCISKSQVLPIAVSFSNVLQDSSKTEVELLEWLSKNELKETDVDKSGKTPLMHACARGYTNLLKYLLEKEVDVNASDNDGWTAIMYAAKNGNLNAISLLYQGGARVSNASIADGFTALHIAAAFDHLDCAMKLMEYGADCKTVDKWDLTPISYFKSTANVETFRRLAGLGSFSTVVGSPSTNLTDNNSSVVVLNPPRKL